ncbi:hypothetical protein QL285_032552 [Trifolium repens]|nr:hypothetical protein QL285_032552 [Trifolium repens]
MNSNSLVRSGSSQFIFQLHCSKLLYLMGENTGLGSVLPQSKKELHKQGTMHDFPSILAKRLIQRQGGQKLSLFVSFPKRGDASSNQPLNLYLKRMVLAVLWLIPRSD